MSCLIIQIFLIWFTILKMVTWITSNKTTKNKEKN